MAKDGTVAASLQHDIDQVQRAQEVIDRDPEAAHAVLERVVTPSPSAGELTMQDIFGLFLQLQKQQAAMQEQMMGLLVGQNRDPGRKNAHTQEELAIAAEQQRLTLEAWRTEPRLPVWLEPDDDEKKIFSVVGDFPPRLWRVNGLEYPIKVGEVVNVPESIAAQISWAQTYSGKRRRPAQAVGTIPDPEHTQFLQGAQSISPGRNGKVGEGPLFQGPVARTAEQAGPLDVRYDHNGQ
jgi:hypothetical protein